MITVNIQEAKTRLSELVRAVEERGEIVDVDAHALHVVLDHGVVHVIDSVLMPM